MCASGRSVHGRGIGPLSLSSLPPPPYSPPTSCLHPLSLCYFVLRLLPFFSSPLPSFTSEFFPSVPSLRPCPLLFPPLLLYQFPSSLYAYASIFSSLSPFLLCPVFPLLPDILPLLLSPYTLTPLITSTSPLISLPTPPPLLFADLPDGPCRRVTNVAATEGVQHPISTLIEDDAPDELTVGKKMEMMDFL